MKICQAGRKIIDGFTVIARCLACSRFRSSNAAVKLPRKTNAKATPTQNKKWKIAKITDCISKMYIKLYKQLRPSLKAYT
jgi:hypothetical protein